MNEQMLEQARNAADPAELLAMAQAAGYPMTEEDAVSAFAMLHPAAGELSDDELEDVSGGGCGQGSTVQVNGNTFTVVTSGCKCFTGQYVANNYDKWYNLERNDCASLRELWRVSSADTGSCGSCVRLEFAGGLGYCGASGKG